MPLCFVGRRAAETPGLRWGCGSSGGAVASALKENQRRGFEVLGWHKTSGRGGGFSPRSLSLGPPAGFDFYLNFIQICRIYIVPSDILWFWVFHIIVLLSFAEDCTGTPSWTRLWQPGSQPAAPPQAKALNTSPFSKAFCFFSKAFPLNLSSANWID